MGRRKSDAFDAATLLLAPSLQYIRTEGKEKQNMFSHQTVLYYSDAVTIFSLMNAFSVKTDPQKKDRPMNVHSPCSF